LFGLQGRVGGVHVHVDRSTFNVTEVATAAATVDGADDAAKLDDATNQDDADKTQDTEKTETTSTDASKAEAAVIAAMYRPSSHCVNDIVGDHWSPDTTTGKYSAGDVGGASTLVTFVDVLSNTALANLTIHMQHYTLQLSGKFNFFLDAEANGDATHHGNDGRDDDDGTFCAANTDSWDYWRSSLYCSSCISVLVVAVLVLCCHA
jgi:hypothetical protein